MKPLTLAEEVEIKTGKGWFVQMTIFAIFIGCVSTVFIWLLWKAYIERRTPAVVEPGVRLVVLRRNGRQADNSEQV
jgi:hypothetical protein